MNKKDYHAYLASEDWAELRLKVIERDNMACRGCKSNKVLQVHHRQYKKEATDNLDDLVAVCRECHCKIHEMAGTMKGRHRIWNATVAILGF